MRAFPGLTTDPSLSRQRILERPAPHTADQEVVGREIRPAKANRRPNLLDHPVASVRVAKELLAEPGYPGGQGLPELSLMIYDGLTIQAEIIQENMRSIGISLKVEIVELNTWFERARSGDFMMNMLPWGVGTVGAAHMYLFHSDSIGTRGNYGKYSNPAVDDLMNKAMQETDRSKMIELMQEANRIITEDAAFINVYTPAEVFVVNKAWDTDRIIQYFIPGMNPYFY